MHFLARLLEHRSFIFSQKVQRFSGHEYNHETFNHMGFLLSVQYSDGTSGLIRCGSWVQARMECVRDRCSLHIKELVPLETLGTKYLKRGSILLVQWEIVLD